MDIHAQDRLQAPDETYLHLPNPKRLQLLINAAGRHLLDLIESFLKNG
ncbi:hypothetical protein BMETH_1811_0 [methanotrophic bacterial endosymbiont of Bathymodiolus sp.]|nr:hypothetical protein BMETH_1811_0 [methanotrophic bacterial endosymbiont of Bathymodiolus sp.]